MQTRRKPFLPSLDLLPTRQVPFAVLGIQYLLVLHAIIQAHICLAGFMQLSTQAALENINAQRC